MKFLNIASYKRKGRSLWGSILNLIFLTGVAVFMILPLVYVASNAFKPMDEMFLFPPRFLFIQHAIGW